MKSIYLDHAAATPMDPLVLAAMQPYLSEMFYNPSATYEAGQQLRQVINTARADIAKHLGSKPSEVVFTAGGTEANNMAIHGVMKQFDGANIVVSSIEHDSVLMPARNYDRRLATVKSDGRLDTDILAGMIDDKTVFVSIQYANNEIGTLQPIKAISGLVADVNRQRQASGNKLPLYLHTDACQAPAYLDIHVSRLGVDMMTINASKIYGPKQTGALFVKTGVKLKPFIQGGGQERGLRSGTENVANIVGFAKALDLVQVRRKQETKRMNELQTTFIRTLTSAVPAATVNGSQIHRLPNNVHVTFGRHDNERLMMELDQRGIQCAVGSACSASNEEPSHVLMALGLTKADAQSSLRFSMGLSTDEAAIKHTVKALTELVS